MSAYPLVSIIMPAYNANSTIQETIGSITQQTLSDFEIIIVDDGSIDGTKKIVESILDRRIRYFYQNHQERAVARNHGIVKATGKYLAFVDADDLWLPEKLEKQLGLFYANPDLGLVYCDLYQFESHTGKNLYRFGKKQKLYRGENIFLKLLKCNFIQSPTPIIRQEVILQAGDFDSAMIPIEDWDLWLRIAERYPIDFVDEPLARYRMHPGGTTWFNYPEKLLDKTFELLKKTELRHPGNRIIKKAIHESHALTLYQLGLAKMRQGNYPRSLQVYSLSLREYPTNIKTSVRILQTLGLMAIHNASDVSKDH